MDKELGKIGSVHFGAGGYQGVMFGLTVTLRMGASGVSDFIGYWGKSIEVTQHTKWTEADRSIEKITTMDRIEQLMLDAKVDDFSKLEGVPVEVTMENMRMLSWRVLTEVL